VYKILKGWRGSNCLLTVHYLIHARAGASSEVSRGACSKLLKGGNSYHYRQQIWETLCKRMLLMPETYMDSSRNWTHISKRNQLHIKD